MSEYLLYVVPRNFRGGDDVMVDITANRELEWSCFAGRLKGVKWSVAKEKLRGLHLRPTDKLDSVDISLKAGVHAQFTAYCSPEELRNAGF
jgi:hypothetical protein